MCYMVGMDEDQSIQFHVRLPRSLFTALEDYWRDQRLRSRSDALRELLSRALEAEPQRPPLRFGVDTDSWAPGGEPPEPAAQPERKREAKR